LREDETRRKAARARAAEERSQERDRLKAARQIERARRRREKIDAKRKSGRPAAAAVVRWACYVTRQPWKTRDLWCRRTLYKFTKQTVESQADRLCSINAVKKDENFWAEVARRAFAYFRGEAVESQIVQVKQKIRFLL
jgi:hypothetical protein